ncbi:MAG: cyclase family protein [Clostridia bacterium]|nr:cyclase family protein [Clostridia bacterium]
MYKLWNELEELKTKKWVSLSHLMDNDSPYWGGIPEGAVKLGETLVDWDNPYVECEIQSFKFPGQFGTHIDFPAHFIKGANYSETFTEKDAVLPLCVVDITAKVKEDCHYCVKVEDIKAYEEKYGVIPKGAFVALRTDWSKNWPDMDKMSGTGEDGSENFPGWSLEAIKYIYEEREAAANGHETLDTDGSAECERWGDLACERYVLDHGKFQVEALTNLDKVPNAGAVIVLAWANFKGANGLPCRAWAICE